MQKRCASTQRPCGRSPLPCDLVINALFCSGVDWFFVFYGLPIYLFVAHSRKAQLRQANTTTVRRNAASVICASECQRSPHTAAAAWRLGEEQFKTNYPETGDTKRESWAWVCCFSMGFPQSIAQLSLVLRTLAKQTRGGFLSRGLQSDPSGRVTLRCWSSKIYFLTAHRPLFRQIPFPFLLTEG